MQFFLLLLQGFADGVLHGFYILVQSGGFPLQVRALSVNGGATQGTIQAVINVTYTYA